MGRCGSSALTDAKCDREGVTKVFSCCSIFASLVLCLALTAAQLSVSQFALRYKTHDKRRANCSLEADQFSGGFGGWHPSAVTAALPGSVSPWVAPWNWLRVTSAVRGLVRSFRDDWAVTLTTLRLAAADTPASEPRARRDPVHSVAAVVTVHSSGMTFQFYLSMSLQSAKCCKIHRSDLNPLCILLYRHPLPPALRFIFRIGLHADSAWPHEIRGNTYRTDYDRVWQIPSGVIRGALKTSVSEICVSSPQKYVSLVAVKPGHWRRHPPVGRDRNLEEEKKKLTWMIASLRVKVPSVR